MDITGQTIGQYRILEPIGAGGMATVFKAYQPGLDRYVAVKVLPAQHALTPGFKERFMREAKAVAQLSHPNILPIYDVGLEDDLSYFVMKYVPDHTLSQLMGQPLPLSRASRYIDQIAGALDHAHRRGILHRDIKPSNMLVEKEEDWLLLADFGLAKIVEGSVVLTGSGAIMGTPAYVSPEQAGGKPVDHRTDIYSLGIVLYEMVTGQVPYAGETPMGIIVKHLIEPLPLPRSLNPDLSEEVERVVLKVLAKEPDDRYERAGELAEALRQAVDSSESVQTAIPLASVDATVPEVQADTSPDVIEQTAPDQFEATVLSKSAVETLQPVGGGQFRWWWLLVGLLVVVIVVGGGVFFAGRGDDVPVESTPDMDSSSDAAAVVDSDYTPTRISSPLPTTTSQPTDTPDVNATTETTQKQTKEARPTDTDTPIPKPTNTPTPTNIPNSPTNTPALTTIPTDITTSTVTPTPTVTQVPTPVPSGGVIQRVDLPDGFSNGITWVNNDFWMIWSQRIQDNPAPEKDVYKQKEICRYDLLDGTLADCFLPTGDIGNGLIWDGNAFWSQTTEELHRIAPQSGEVLKTISLPDGVINSSDLAWDGEAIWVTQVVDKRFPIEGGVQVVADYPVFHRIDPENGAVLASVTSSSPITPVEDDILGDHWQTWGMTWDGEHLLWNYRGHRESILTVQTVSIENGSILKSMPVKDCVGTMAWDGNYLWIVGGQRNAINKVVP